MHKAHFSISTDQKKTLILSIQMGPLQLDWNSTHTRYLNSQIDSNLEATYNNRNPTLPFTYPGINIT